MENGKDTLPARLVSADEVTRRVFIERKRGSRVVFTNGVFDVLHRGHVEYLKAAAALGAILVVGLNSDESVRRLKGPRRPLMNQDDRAALLLALRDVDYVVLFDDDTPANLIETIQPEILVKGGDYRADDIVGAEFVRQHGGEVVAIPFRDGYSTSGLIETIVERYADECLKT